MQYLIPNKYSKILQNINMKLYISNELIKIYSILYDAARKGYNNPKYNKIVDKNYNIRKKKGICICCIVKRENIYIREFY